MWKWRSKKAKWLAPSHLLNRCRWIWLVALLVPSPMLILSHREEEILQSLSKTHTHTHTPQSWQTICSINTKLCVCTWTRISVWVHCALAHALLYIQSVSLHVIFFMDFYLFLKLLLRHHLTWRLPSPSLHTAELISPPYNFCACKYLHFYIYHIGGDIAHLDGQRQRLNSKT